jgi:hypothetical protein
MAAMAPNDGQVIPAVTEFLEELSARGIAIHPSRFDLNPDFRF